MDTNATIDRIGWPVNEWAYAAGMSRASAWGLIKQRKIESVKFGVKRLIVTHPRDFLAGLAASA